MPVVTPPAAPAYMLSLLRRRISSSGTIFATGDGGHWLVWEPGKWSASSGFEPTQQPKGHADAPALDSLAFHLKERVPLKLGRAASCDIVINDATVSREHVKLEPQGELFWKLTVLSSSSETLVGGVKVASGETRELSSGTAIAVGDVLLTYWDGEGLTRRLTGR